MWRRDKLIEKTKQIIKDIKELKLSIVKLNKRIDKLATKNYMQKVTNKKVQQKTPKKRNINGNQNARFWTEIEEKQLITELTQKTPINNLAIIHNRTNNAIGSRIIKIIRDYIKLGTTCDNISKNLNVDINFVNLVSTSNDNKMLLEKLITQ